MALAFGLSYQYNRAMSNTDGWGPSWQIHTAWRENTARRQPNIRHRVSPMGTITTKWGIRFNPMLTANSGPPFNITVGQDVYGTTLFNGRPGIATDPNKPGVVLTSYGLLILIRLPMNDCSPGTSDADRVRSC